MSRKCFVCGTGIYISKKKVVNFGKIYPSAFVDEPVDDNSKKVDLSLSQCTNCGLVLLNKALPPDEMYREYWYRSSCNSSMVTSLRDVLKEINTCIQFHPQAVMDIGCNDGTLLGMYDNQHVFRVGYDPANNLADKASANCNVFINDYFDGKIHYGRKFDVVTSIAMFYDVPSPDKFIQDIKSYLAPQGVWCCQMTDLTCMLRANAFDNICHEHIAYYTLDLFKKMLNRNGMDLFHVSYNNVNGGSVRAFACHKNHRPIRDTVYKSLKNEREVLSGNYFCKFNTKTKQIITNVTKFIRGANACGQKVFGLGASTKGNTFLQVAGLTGDDLPCIMEVSDFKFKKYTLGSNIYITSEADGFANNPNYVLILPWHFTKNIVAKNQAYLDKGGVFIVPMPEPVLIDKNGQHPLS